MRSRDTSSGRRYHTDGDFDGELVIQVRPDEVEPNGPGAEPGYAVRLPWNDLLDMVADRVHEHRVKALENMSALELLGLPSANMTVMD